MLHIKADDAKAGMLFLLVGLFFGTTAVVTLDIGTVEEMGAGFFPLLLSAILIGLGLTIVIGARPAEAPQRPVKWRAVLLITLAIIAFGGTVRPLGLLPALLITVALTVLANRESGLLRQAMTVGGITLFCVLIFKLGVQVPFALVNPALLP